MEFTIETQYDQPAMKAMARALRKTLRANHSRRSHRVGWIIVALGGILLLSAAEINFNIILTGLADAAIVLALLFEDDINGYVARKRILPGLTVSTAVFTEETYQSKTPVGESLFPYENIVVLAETKDYFVFVFSTSHAQVYSKAGLSGGSEAEFRKLLEDRTGKTFVPV